MAPFTRSDAPLTRLALSLFAISSIAVWGCGAGDESAELELAHPVEIAGQEDAVCGMLVGEQSAPRAQLIHRDGERAFFCSLGDLLVQLSAPSPHGSTRVVFVEVMQPDEDPLQSHTAAHPWRRADEATYVVGVERPNIMGAPVLAYARADEARLVASRHVGSRVVDLQGLRQWWSARQAGR